MAFIREKDSSDLQGQANWNDNSDTYNASTRNWNRATNQWQPREVVMGNLWNNTLPLWNSGTELSWYGDSGSPTHQWNREEK